MSALLIALLAGPTLVPTPIEAPERIAGFLDALGKPARVRVTHFGDSHIAADLWTAPIRRGLQERFGDGGRGFVLAGKPWSSYWQDGVANRTEGRWAVAGIKGGVDDGWFGPGSCSMASTEPATLTVGLADGHPGFGGVDVHYLRQPSGGCFELRLDGQPTRRISTRGPWLEPGFARIEAEPGTRTVTLHPLAGTGQVRLFGASLDNHHGLVWDALGLNGARATKLLRTDPIGFTAGIRRLDPRLIVLSYGANEVYDDDFDPGSYAGDQDRVMRRIRQAAPDADCLLTGPPDMLKGRGEPPGMPALYAIQRETAQRHGCAFWDTQRYMGGPGSIRVWRKARLAGRDHVHLTKRGYEHLGEGLLAAILAAHAR